MSEQFVMVKAVTWIDGNADACTHSNFASVDRDRFADPVDQSRSQPQCFRQITDAFADDRELVASKARNKIVRGNCRLDKPGNVLEQAVAEQVAAGIIDAFEAVEVEKHHD